MPTARRKTAAAKSRRKANAAARVRRRAGRNPLARTRRAMARAMSPDLAEMRIELRQLMSDIEKRMDRINGLTKRGAGHAVDGVNDLVAGAVSGVTDRVRANARAFSDDAARLGNEAVREVASQIDKRPLLTLAVAAGIGFLIGVVRRQD